MISVLYIFILVKLHKYKFFIYLIMKINKEIIKIFNKIIMNKYNNILRSYP
jgi:hypothetical protein